MPVALWSAQCPAADRCVEWSLAAGYRHSVECIGIGSLIAVDSEQFASFAAAVIVCWAVVEIVAALGCAMASASLVLCVCLAAVCSRSPALGLLALAAVSPCCLDANEWAYSAVLLFDAAIWSAVGSLLFALRPVFAATPMPIDRLCSSE